MNSTLLKKYETIEQSKVSEKDKKVLEQVKKLSNNFEETDEAKNKVAEKILDQIIKINPDAIKKPQVVAQKVAKVQKVAKAKKVAQAKKTATTTPKKSDNNIMSVAKEIQKDGESWKDAMERAKQVLKERKEQVVQKQKTELEKLYALVKTKKELKGFANSDIRRDSVRDAKPRGARFVTKEGFTSNQYKKNVPNKIGRKYWETRDRHADRLAPNYPKDMPLLASGGAVSDAPFSVEVFKTKLRFDNELPSSSKGDFPTFAKAKEFAIDMIDNGNYYAHINSKSGYLWGVDSKGVEQFDNGGMFEAPIGVMREVKGKTISVPVSEEIYSSEINRFVDYVDGFYGKKGIYAEDLEGGFTKAEIKKAVNKYIENLNSNGTWGGGDSLDRERVRQILQPSYKMANGGEVKSVVDAIFEFNEKRGKLNTSFGAKTKEGITALIENDNYSSEEITKAIFYSNNKKEKISTGYGDKSFFGLQDMIERARGKEYADGGSVSNERMYNFLKDDLEKLEVAINDGDKEEVERFFSYWGYHLKSLENKGFTENYNRMYNFLKDDLKELENAINDGNTEEVERFFSYWGQHLESLKMAKGGELTLYKIQQKDKYDLQPKWEDEKFLTGGRKFLTFKQAQDFKKKLQGLSSSIEYKVVKVGENEKLANGGNLPFMTDPNFGNFQNTGMFEAGGSMADLTEQEFLKKHFSTSVFSENPSQYFEIKKLSSSDDAKVSAFVKELKADGFTVKKRAFSDFTSVMGVKKKASFELGGAFMMTDLAGHTGGSDGLGNPMPLSGVSGTHYTGLVGETGAMSSGELFMDGGAMAQNQQLINDASQSYVNYYLGEGASQGIYKDGGGIPNNYEGKYYGDIWDKEWTNEQKYHFLSDHKNEIGFDEELYNESSLKRATKRMKSSHGNDAGFQLIDSEKLVKTKSSELPRYVNFAFKNHIREGQYAYGGRTKSTPSMRKLYIEQIAFATNTRAVGVDDFAKEHNLTDSELSNLMTGIGRKMISQSDFITALVGNKNNPKQKEVVAFAKSDKAYKMADGGALKFKVGQGEKYFDKKEKMQLTIGKESNIPNVYNVNWEDGENSIYSADNINFFISKGIWKKLNKMADGGSFGDDFEEVIDLGAEQYYTRPFGIVESESNGEVELVVVATIKDLEDYMPEEDLPEEGNFQLDITLVPTEEFISEEMLESANDEDSSVSDDSVVNLVNYAGGLNYSPQERVFFESHQDALDYLMSEELKDQINKDTFSSDYIMYKKYNRAGQTNSDYLDYLMGVTDRFAKGGSLKNAKELSEEDRFELKVLQGLSGFRNAQDINGLYEALGFSNYRFNQYATESQAQKVEKALNSLIKKGFVDESGLGYKITQKGADYRREFHYGSYAKGGSIDDSIIDELWSGYASAVLFTETDSDSGEPLDSEYSVSDFDEETESSTKKMLAKFYLENKDAIEESELDLDTIGNDVWYTRSGQGAGFFDHSLDSEIEEQLIKGAKALGEYPSVETYDGKISVRGGRAFAKGGFVGTVEFNVGDIVWDKGNKTYGTVMNNFGDPINGDDGELRLDSDGMQVIFLYDKGYKNRIGYNLVKLGDKGDAGKFTPVVLDELKASAERMMKYAERGKDKEQIKYYQEVYKRTLDGEFDSMTGAKATASKKSISNETTYVPNRDVKELSVVVKGELKQLKGSDIVDGVYVKNSAKSSSKVDANAVFAKILKDAKEAKQGKSKRFEASELKKINLEMVQKLAEAGYSEQQIRNVILGYAFDNEIVAENEIEYDKGVFSYEESYVKEKIDDLVDAQKNKEFVAGIEYPDFDWQGIIKKYKISSKPKEIVIKRNFGNGSYNENYYEVFVGENIALGHNIGYKNFDSNGKLIDDYLEKGKKVTNPTKQNAWQKERGQKAGFNGGYWYVVSSKIETIDDVLKTLLSQKDGYCKELELYSDSFAKTLKENNVEFADGGLLSSNEIDKLDSGFTISQLDDMLRKMFPYSFGVDVFKAGKNLFDYNLDDKIKDDKLKLYFYDKSSNRELNYEVHQGQENTYFDFMLFDEEMNTYIGTFGFKDRGDVDKSYITKFVSFLHDAYHYPFQVRHSVMANGGFMSDVYAKGGELQGKFLAEIGVPYNFEYVVKDEFEFTEFLSKTLTKKWFGNGIWGVKMVKPLFEKNYGQKVVVEIEIPVGVTQRGGLDKFDVGEFISKTLTKKWFGNGIWGVDVVGNYAKGGNVKKYIDHNDINYVTLIIKGKTTIVTGSDVLNGANLLEDGGDLSKIAFYVPKRDVVSVKLKNGETVKPVNGYWVKKDYEPVVPPTKAPKSGKVTSPNYPNVNFNHKVVINGKTVHLALAKNYVTGLDGSRQYDFIDVDGNPMIGYGFSVKEALNQIEKFAKFTNNSKNTMPTTNGGKMRSKDINSKLEDFDLDNLDPFETMQYNQFVKSSGKVGALQVLINNVEGDYTQLSPELAELAEMQMSTEEYDEATRQMRFERDGYANGGSLGYYDVVIDGDWDEPKKFKTFSLAKKWIYENIKNHDSLELVDSYGDTIYVDGDSTKEDLEWLFSNEDVSSFANGGGVSDYMNSPEYKEMFNKMQKLTLDVKSRVVRAVGLDSAIEFYDSDYPVRPYQLLERAVRGGFITLDDINERVVDSAMETAQDSEDDEEVGSSDFTSYLHNFLDEAGFKVGYVNGRLTREFADDSYAKGGSTDSLSVNKASILSATKKCTDGDSDRSTCQSGNFEVTMVYYYGSLDLDFVYLDYNNPRFNPSKEHYASYSFTKGSKGVLTYFDPTVYTKQGRRTDASTIVLKTIEVLKTLGYPVDFMVDRDGEKIEDIKYADGGFMNDVYAKGGMIDYSKDGYVKAIRNIDGKMIKEITVNSQLYRFNPIYKTYNSVKNNEILHKSKYADGGAISEDILECKKLVSAFCKEFGDKFGLDEEKILDGVKFRDNLGYGAKVFVSLSVSSNVTDLKVGETRPTGGYIIFTSDINPNGVTGKDDIARTYSIDIEIKGSKRYTQRRTEEGRYFKSYNYGRTIEEVMDKTDTKIIYDLYPLEKKDDLKFKMSHIFADGGMFSDNDGFMKADNNRNFRYSEKEVYVETIDEPIDLTDYTEDRTNEVDIRTIDNDIDLTDDRKIKARLTQPKRGNGEKFLAIAPNAFEFMGENIPMPSSNKHKND